MTSSVENVDSRNAGGGLSVENYWKMHQELNWVTYAAQRSAANDLDSPSFHRVSRSPLPNLVTVAVFGIHDNLTRW